MASFLDAAGIKSLLPLPSATPSAITMNSSANALTPAPAQFQSIAQPSSAATSKALPVRLQYPATLVTFVHEGELARGVTKLLTLRGTSFSLEDVTKRSLGQVFTVDSNGVIRSAFGSGPLVSSNSTCTGLQATSHNAGGATTGWTFEPKSSGAYDVMVPCSTGIKRIGIDNGTLVMTSDVTPGWFIISVATV
jgi:hypothetical protein